MNTADIISGIRSLAANPRSAISGLFVAGTPIYVARAPGRLDVIGGIADYSGSLVLEMPIAEAAFVAVQAANSEDGVVIVSLPQQPSELPRRVSIPANDWAEMEAPTMKSLASGCEKIRPKPGRRM